MHNILIFGGTFDPVHNGHIHVAINVQKSFLFERFIFLPCKIPLLKNAAQANPQQRIDMLDISLNEHPGYRFETDSREIIRDTPSYMVTTLEDYRLEMGKHVSITLLMGKDSFADLPCWHNWGKLLSLCNILVIDRPGDTNFSPTVQSLLAKYETDAPENLKKHSHGIIYRFHAGDYEVSSTVIRHQLAEHTTAPLLVPSSVKQYIKNNKLYLK